MSSKLFVSLAEFGEKYDRDLRRRQALHPGNSDHPTGFRFNEQHLGYEIWWGGYEYFIELDRITSPMSFLIWLRHLTAKTWEGITPDRVCYFIEDVCERRGWDVLAEPGRDIQNSEALLSDGRIELDLSVNMRTPEPKRFVLGAAA